MRTETTTRNLFPYSELSDEAKEKARDWWRDCEARSGDNFFAECVIEDADNIGEILGIEFARSKRGKEPAVYWSGFWSQGDGACFEGFYSYAKGSSAAIRKHAPLDKELHRIADELAKVQRRNFYRLHASCEQRGHYQHSGCMSVSVEYDGEPYRDLGEDEETVRQLLRDFADWIYNRLENEYDYTMSDEAVEEAIISNEYEFTEDGNIA